jgi:hypothetical protein
MGNRKECAEFDAPNIPQGICLVNGKDERTCADRRKKQGKTRIEDSYQPL